MILLHIPVTPSATLSKERQAWLRTAVQTKPWKQHSGPNRNGCPHSTFGSVHNNLENPNVPFLRILLLLNTCQNLRHEPGSLIPLDAPKSSEFKWPLTESFDKVMLPHSMLSVIRLLWEQAIGVLLESWHVFYSSPTLLPNPNANIGS